MTFSMKMKGLNPSIGSCDAVCFQVLCYCNTKFTASAEKSREMLNAAWKLYSFVFTRSNDSFIKF